MQVLRASDYKRMPWKNGGGETVEIAVFPPGSSVDDFDWRISMATVASDGPFSIFPQIDRTLSILDGNGMSLSIGGAGPVLLTTGSEPFSFAADVPVDATLAEETITDLNVMTRRGRFSHRVERVCGDFTVGRPSDGETVLVLSTEKAHAEANGNASDLEALDAILISAETRVEAEGSVCFLIRLNAI